MSFSELKALEIFSKTVQFQDNLKDIEKNKTVI